MSVQKQSVSFTDTAFAFAKELVEAGEYPNVSAAVSGELVKAKAGRERERLGSRLIEFHNQKMMVAARRMAERKVSGHRSYRVATRRQSLSLPNMISMRLRRL